MGDRQTELLRPHFDRRLRLEFHGANVTSDAGLLAYRELDGALQLTATAWPRSCDSPSSVAWPGMRTSTMLSACASTPRCVWWSAVGPGTRRPPRPARSAVLRPTRSQPA